MDEDLMNECYINQLHQEYLITDEIFLATLIQREERALNDSRKRSRNESNSK
jgi:hypothetical protein